MTIFPLPLTELLGHWGSYIVYLFIGIAFGAVLEMAGFGNSRKLAAQFYFKDMTVLKVMFTAIIVAMALIFAATALGLLDYNLIWVNPTYLWPGIVGGLIMGAGFIIGGFCPGTSLVALATFKKDGLFFVLGVLSGIFLFGETVDRFSIFWNSSYMGRFTLPELFGLPTGIVVLLVVLMALLMFWGGEKLEQHFGGKDLAKAPKWRYGAAGVLVAGAVGLIVIGQPTNMDRWQAIESEKQTVLDQRLVQIHPGELLDTLHDTQLKVIMLDVRDEVDYNLFHILDSRHVPADELPGIVDELHLEPANTLFVAMSNDEKAATDAWKFLEAESLPNVYILEGGINNWIATFGDDDLTKNFNRGAGDDQLCYIFDSAVGSRYTASEPDPHAFDLIYTPKVQMELKRAPSSGGCG
ncbi:MAG: YeeE/YedE thiosulfate transporter family protein [Candidatus Promineifilaceae bacterium]|nr:YeeE/YedE thiosulfate transporter family protein [Candidatus Promineifilaceae bacterium]